MTNIESSVIKTLAFFDIFDYPLTDLEIWKWLYKPGEHVSLSELRETLAHSDFLAQHIILSEGFYSLQDSPRAYLRRKQNNNLAERKFAKAIRIAKIFRFIPFVRMIAVCNTLAYSNAREESDIDLFIISKHNKMWLTRFFTVSVTKLLRLRPHEEDKKDTICLSFFLDENYLNIKNAMINDKDIYFPYWTQQLMPIYDPDGLYKKFMEANEWYQEYLPNGYNNYFAKQVKERPVSKIFGKIFSWLTSPVIVYRFFDDFYRRFQIRIIDKNLKSLVNVDTGVIINDQMLKFHIEDKREMFAKQWKEKCNEHFKSE